MARKAVIDIVAAVLAGHWTHCPVFHPNTTAEPPEDGSPYIVVQYPYANSEQKTFGAPGGNKWRDDGAFRLVIHVGRGDGIDAGTQWADELATMFRGKDLGAIQTWAPSAPVTDDRNSAAQYYVLSIAVPYWHDYLG